MLGPPEQIEPSLIEILLEFLTGYRASVDELGRFAPPSSALFLNDLRAWHPCDMKRHRVFSIYEHRDRKHHALVHGG